MQRLYNRFVDMSTWDKRIIQTRFYIKHHTISRGEHVDDGLVVGEESRDTSFDDDDE
jgi:hypothetical protein